MKHPTSNIQRRTSKAWLVPALLALALVAVCAPKTLAQTTNAPARLNYDSFRTISDRNIFNPNRYTRATGRPATTRPSTQPAARVESFSLLGIMAYEKGWFAFFDGTKSDYKQALQADSKIGEYKVLRVTPDEVMLATGTNTFALKVGMQLRREDEGDWFLSEAGDAPRRRVISTRTRTRSSSPGEPGTTGGEEIMNGGEPEIIVIEGDPVGENGNGETPAVNGNATPDASGITDPVLLRLMQRRQEMNQ